MPKEDNLIPLTQRSPEEAAEIRRKGGKARQEQIKQKKQMRDCFEELLALPCSDIRRFNKMCRMGIDPESIDNKMALVAAVYNTAVRDGDINALDKIRSIIGEDNAPNDDTLQKLDEVLDNIGGNI